MTPLNPPTKDAASWKAWVGFTAMTIGMFFAILDIQVVASSLIDIQMALGIPGNRLSYIQTTYLIAEVIAIALTGWLTRVMSTRWLFVWAMGGFVLASVGCAAATSYEMLFVFRFIQGLFGGAIIPLVFTAVFLLFPARQQTIATVIGGGFAMLAPTVGPFIGGWITETLSWHWLFLINIAPGFILMVLVGWLIRVDEPDWGFVKTLDWITLVLIALALGTLELTLKEAPTWGWVSLPTFLLASVCVISGSLSVRRCAQAHDPLVNVHIFQDRTFAVGAAYSFVLGMALFGMVYLLPLFLGIVRDLGPIEIGTIMMVTGAAQLLIAPVAAYAETRIDCRLMALIGYSLFAVGLLANGFATPTWGFDELFWPQVLRGMAVMICLLPITRLALGQLPHHHVAQGSAIFNLMRNLGGAVGLALIDTIIQTRSADHAAHIGARLQAGDREMAAFVGLPLERFQGQPMEEISEATREIVQPLVEKAAAVMSFNDAWIVIGSLVALSLLALPLMKKVPPATTAETTLNPQL